MPAEPAIADRLWRNATLVTMDGPPEAPLGLIADGAIAARDGRIAWLGPRAEAPPARETIDAGGAHILPGLIDCHTHLVFGGDRAAEFEARLEGATYEQLAKAGGGILATVRATRAASEAALIAAATPRLAALAAEGVTTLEIKSGYGLDLATESRQLRAARALAARHAMRIETSLLAAHATPPEYAGRRADYAAHIAHDILPAIARDNLADAVDAFLDTDIAFTAPECAMIFDIAQSLGLPTKLHADQRRDDEGAAFAARHGAISADHIEYANAAGLRAMARAGTVGVLLPGAYLTLRETHPPDIAAMREAGLAMAIATDANPGSSPTLSLLLMLNLACTLFRLTPTEALLGVTRHAATALGKRDRGRLAPGLLCDLALFAIERPAELCYWMGRNPCTGRVVGGA